MSNIEQDGKKLTRREFLREAGVAAVGLTGAAIAAGTEGTVVGISARAAFGKNNFASWGIARVMDLVGGGVVSAETSFIIKDPMGAVDHEPIDLSLERNKIQPLVDEVYGTNGGIESYRNFLRKITQEKIILFGEAHANDGDKLGLRETITTLQNMHPGQQIILAMGRFQAYDNRALAEYIRNSSHLSDDEAIEQLQNYSSYHDNWVGQTLGLTDSATDSARQIALTLTMCRRTGIDIVGLGVDVGFSLNGADQSPEEISTLETKAANIILDLHKNNPNAVIISQAGRPHIIRGEQEQGITPKLEKMLSQRNLPLTKPPRVVSVQTVDPVAGDGYYFFDEMRFMFNEGGRVGKFGHNPNSLFNNSAFVVRSPQFSSARGSEGVEKRIWPGCDFLLARFLNNG